MKHLIRSLFTYDSDVNFQSNFPLDESIQRLGMFLQREEMKKIHPDGAYLAGKVARKKVVLFRKNLSFGNSYRPLFVGRFVEIDGTLYLQGAFRMHLFDWVSILLGLLCVLSYELIVILLTINGHFSGDSLLTQVLRLLFLPAVAALYLGFLILMGRISRNDVKWISDHVVCILTPEDKRGW